MANHSITFPFHFSLLFFIFIFSNAVLFCSFPLLSAASDCLEEGQSISSSNASSNLVSPQKKFEVGFFTPDGRPDKGKYLGIWPYYNPKIVVWVANRNKVIVAEPNASLVIQHGHVAVLGNNGTSYWSASDDRISIKRHLRTINITTPKENNTIVNKTMRLCIGNDGNLILQDRLLQEQAVWKSFDTPITDTFLPGINPSIIKKINPSIILTSWKSGNNPTLGGYNLVLDGNSKIKVQKTKATDYWVSELTSFDTVPPIVNDLLKGNDTVTVALRMSFTGQIQLWKWGRNGGNWSLSLEWEEPKDRCSMSDVCGSSASCNSNNGILCKCLPGFKPVSEKWNMGTFSDGCESYAESRSPGERNNYKEDVFLKLPMMRVGNPGYTDESIRDCKNKCLSDTTCQAYSCGIDDCSINHTIFMRWTNTYHPTNLQEQYPRGYTLFVRTTSSDLKSNSRSCSPCGTYIIPYPLSTGADCGDSSYFHFSCNSSTGQVSFFAPKDTYNITSIDPDGTKIFIQPGEINKCDTGFMSSLTSSIKPLPFQVTNCTVINVSSFTGFEQSYVEIEMSWYPPLEPTCNTSSDCADWPHTTCKAAKDDQMRCLCKSKFRWEGLELKCNPKGTVRLKVILASTAGALGLILLCGTFFSCRIKKKVPLTNEFLILLSSTEIILKA